MGEGWRESILKEWVEDREEGGESRRVSYAVRPGWPRGGIRGRGGGCQRYGLGG